MVKEMIPIFDRELEFIGVQALTQEELERLQRGDHIQIAVPDFRMPRSHLICTTLWAERLRYHHKDKFLYLCSNPKVFEVQQEALCELLGEVSKVSFPVDRPRRFEGGRLPSPTAGGSVL